MESKDNLRLLNVGGGSHKIKLPSQYSEWEVTLLDLDASGRPDIICDARELISHSEQKGLYDAVYCSHNLEHYYLHDVPKVLSGFMHVIKPDGFVHLRVPDLLDLMNRVVKKNLDIDDVLYEAPIGKVKVRDVIYGYANQIEKMGNDLYAHKTGFSRRSLADALKESGFNYVYTKCENLEIIALAFRDSPTRRYIGLFDV